MMNVNILFLSRNTSRSDRKDHNSNIFKLPWYTVVLNASHLTVSVILCGWYLMNHLI